MKRNKIWLKSFFIGMIVLLGCAKQGEFIPARQYSNTPNGNYDAFWNGVNQNYIFFEETKANWDSIYVKYADSVNSSTSKTRLFNIFSKMMRHLVDGHRVLKAEKSDRDNFLGGNIGPIDGSFFVKYPDYDVFDTTSFITKYLGGKHGQFSSFADNEEPSKKEMLYGIIENRILYARMFFFGNAFSEFPEKVETAKQDVKNFLDSLQNASNSGAGLILDLRFNSGGNAREFYEMGSFFVDKDYEWGFNQVRIGTGKNDLSPFISEKFTKSKLGVYFKNKVVILTNKRSASAAEILSISLKELPNVTILGDTTFGANGPISKGKEFTGNFTLPNNWEMQLAQRKTFDKKL
ncbi:MAG: hypothetical protein EAZ53_01460 [Bacteroidetes bacterium]|nr:MAG: hypothetical protein EAZ53_01460 [Bacteroidota bacterium]